MRMDHLHVGWSRVWGGLALVLISALFITWGIRAWHLDNVAGSIEALQERDVQRALAYVDRDLERRLGALADRANSYAQNEQLLQGLRAIHRGDDVQGRGQVTREVASWQLSEPQSAEVYDATQRLLSWTGFSIPLDHGPRTVHFQSEPVVTTSSDDGYRQALTLWLPVREGRDYLGHLRVMEQVQYRTPVQNQYIRDYDLEDEWNEKLRSQTEMRFGEEDEEGHVVRSADGALIGTLFIQPLEEERMLQHTAHFYDGFAAVLIQLFLFLMLAAAWQWYRHERRPPEGASVHRHLWTTSMRFLGVAVLFWATRYVFLLMDFPGRWVPSSGMLSPLFDPTHLASTFGGGLLRSTGDLLITGIFAFVFAVGLLHLATHFRNKGLNLWQVRDRVFKREAVRPSTPRFLLILFVTTLTSLFMATLTAVIAQRAVLDSTLDYFTRTGLLPDMLTMAVFCGLLLITMAALLSIACATWMALWFLLRFWPSHRSPTTLGAAVILTMLGAFGVWFGYFGGMGALTWVLGLTFFLVGVSIAAFGFLEPGAGIDLLELRRLLPALLLVTVLLYPLLYTGMDTQRRERMIDAVETFSEGRDPRVLFSMEQVLEEIRDSEHLVNLLHSSPQEADLDSLTEHTLRGSLLTSLGTYQVTLALYDNDGRPLGQHTALGPAMGRASDQEQATIEFDILRQMYTEMGTVGTMVEQLTGPRTRDRFQYAGLVPLFDPEDEPELHAPGVAMGDDKPLGWAVLAAEPQSLIPDGGTPFPRVLLPAGYYGDLYATFSLSEFRQGVLVRSLGRDFGRYRLDESIQEILRTQMTLWQVEEVEGRSHLTYYERHAGGSGDARFQLAQPLESSITAVRAPAVVTFDHLYYILRLFIAGLLIGALLFAAGLFVRWQRGQLPAEQVRFRDKMQNAFLVVGALSVVVVGWIGMEVLRDENQRSTQNWLRQRLEQVEETLMLESRQNEPPHQTIERIGLDELSIRVGLDLNLYEDGQLITSSRPRLVRERLIGERMPIEAYQSLHFDGYRFTTSDERIGDFAYTAGYRALTDEEGDTRYIISVPTLPEQERMEEEQARTIAYLFGALLLLVVIIMLTASLLAGALARPIARLREGLEAIGKGEFAQALPVDTRDEIGELVETFNEMREQLAESRRKLAQQERELAWREMARQVAHEIKNPLTPMKLSVQHLRRAFKRKEVPAGDHNEGRHPDFADLFNRITSTLIEQIDALARIANEFSSFSRLPTQVPELLDLNEVIEGAISLMQEEVGIDIDVDFYEDPLVVKADQEELRRAYINLLKNAEQSVPDDRKAKISVTTFFEPDSSTQHGYASSTVTDNGSGIPEELRDKIFQPNFSTKNSGTGLGLAIVKKSVEDIGGEIGFETTDGEGTTFWIKLPLAKKKQSA